MWDNVWNNVWKNAASDQHLKISPLDMVGLFVYITLPADYCQYRVLVDVGLKPYLVSIFIIIQ